MLILTIPLSLLYRVQIATKQKFGLAAFLCLSIFMIVVAAIRVSGFHYEGTWDNTWIFFWQQIEASVAVAMISVTAFRSAFVADGSRKRSGRKGSGGKGSGGKGPGKKGKFWSPAQPTPSPGHTRGFSVEKSNAKPMSMVQKALHLSHKNQREREADLENLTIPRATMTGMRTAIRGDGSHLETDRTGEETLVGSPDREGDYWSTRSVSTDKKVAESVSPV